MNFACGDLRLSPSQYRCVAAAVTVNLPQHGIVPKLGMVNLDFQTWRMSRGGQADVVPDFPYRDQEEGRRGFSSALYAVIRSSAMVSPTGVCERHSRTFYALKNRTL